MKNMLLVVMLAGSPAAAQTEARAPAAGTGAIPGLGASFDGARLGDAPTPTAMMTPTLSPGLQAPALALLPTPAPTLVQPAPAAVLLAAAAGPIEGSPLGAIRDASADEARKAAALDRFFEGSAPASPEALAVSALPAAALAPQGSNEFSQAPDWFDASRLKFDALVESGTGGTAVLRYGWRNQYEMSVFAFPGGAGISFKEYSADPMGAPKRSFDAALETAAGRKAAAKLLRAARARHPVSGKDGAALDRILAFLDGRGNATVEFYSRLGIGPIKETPRGGIEMSATRPGGGRSMVIRWRADTGFDFIRSDGFHYFISQNHLRGVRASLLKAMQESAPTSLQRRLLEKLDAAITPRRTAGSRSRAPGEVL